MKKFILLSCLTLITVGCKAKAETQEEINQQLEIGNDYWNYIDSHTGDKSRGFGLSR